MAVKLTLFCDKCGHATEFAPETYGNLSYVDKALNQKGFFTIYGSNIEPNLSADLNDDFISKLTEANDINEVTEILEDDIISNVSSEPELNDLRFDCQHCGSYLVLQF